MQPIISAKHIFKQYANHIALDDVSVDIPAQSIFGYWVQTVQAKHPLFEL